MSTLESHELRDYVVALRSRWEWILVAVVVSGVLGLVLASTLDNAYESTTSVLLRPLSTDPLEQLTDANRIDTSTERELALSVEVATDAAELLELDGEVDVLALREDLQVVTAAEAAVLRFVYAHEDADEAARRSQAFADAYLDARLDRAEQALDRVRTAVDGRLDEIREEEAALTERLDALLVDEDDDGEADGDANQIRQLEAELSIARQQRASIAGEQSRYRVISVDAGEILTPAAVPDDPSGVPGSLIVAALLLIGLIAGVLLALLAHRLSNLVLDADEVRDLFDAPILGYVLDRHPRRALELDGDDVRSAMRRASANIASRREQMDVAVLLPLIEADESRMLGDAFAVGLGRFGTSVLLDATRSTNKGRVDDSQETAELVRVTLDEKGRDSTTKAVALLSERYERIVVASPTLGESTAALDLSDEPGCVVVPVVRLGHARRDEVRMAIHDLQLVRADVGGILIIGPRSAWGSANAVDHRGRPLDGGVVRSIAG